MRFLPRPGTSFRRRDCWFSLADALHDAAGKVLDQAVAGGRERENARAHAELPSVILVHLPLAGELDRLAGGKPGHCPDGSEDSALSVPQAEYGVRVVLAFVHDVFHLPVELVLGEGGVFGFEAEFVRHGRPRV